MDDIRLELLPKDACGLRLAKINQKDELILCESVIFIKGFQAVHTTLRRARLSGHVKIAGEIKDHFADILDRNGYMLENVALDQDSYKSLKNKWMRCKIDQFEDIMRP